MYLQKFSVSLSFFPSSHLNLYLLKRCGESSNSYTGPFLCLVYLVYLICKAMDMSISLCVELCPNIYSFVVSPDISAKFGSKPHAIFQVEVLLNWESGWQPSGCQWVAEQKQDCIKANLQFYALFTISH